MLQLRTPIAPYLLTLGALSIALGCGDDDGNAADRLGVGAQCAGDDDCLQSHVDGGLSETCLLQFKGGYCGIQDCASSDDCPAGSECVVHDDGNNYCFRTCANKPECNLHRDPENEANCSSNVDYAGATKADDPKACVPPSSG
jgi:hypothetical protein